MELRYRVGCAPLQAGGARRSDEEVSILYPGTVSTTLPANGPFALPHQLFSAATLYRVAGGLRSVIVNRSGGHCLLGKHLIAPVLNLIFLHDAFQEERV